MNNYILRLGLTVWRKKTTLIFALGILIFTVYALKYVRVDPNLESGRESEQAQMVADALLRSINVKFVDESNSNRQQLENNLKTNHPPNIDVDPETNLGIPYVELDGKKPYVPVKRLVHLDLKGAPPTVAYLKEWMGMIRTMGATGILLEYEDMFPFEGTLRNVSASNAYTVEQIKEILSTAALNNLEIIPLVQTFGHLEFVLKHKEFAHLREVKGSPQALCPSRRDSLELVKQIVKQIISMHPSITHLHIGCDEVFQMGECQLCRLESRDNLFLSHIRTVSSIIHALYPNLHLIIWDDMLRHIPIDVLVESNLGKMVEPMVWVYAEDIYRFVQPGIWEKYSKAFDRVWAASAFKGAFGETLYVPNARRHLENNLRWLEVMSTQSNFFKKGFSGLALTGWQRYDHFAILCELLPVAVPSLALSLVAVSTGFFNSSSKEIVLKGLSCPNTEEGGFVTLDSDPFLWDKMGKCLFPGNTVFQLTDRLHHIELDTRHFLDSVHHIRAWLTDYNIRHNYTLPLRVDEILSELPSTYQQIISLATSAKQAMEGIFDSFTLGEWVEQRIYPMIEELEKLKTEEDRLRNIEEWPRRPLPVLEHVKKLVGG